MNEVFSPAICHQPCRLTHQVRVSLWMQWLNSSRCQDQADNSRISTRSLVPDHRCPAGAVSCKNHLGKTALLRKTDPRGDVTGLLTRNSPIPAAADPPTEPIRRHRSYVVHAGIHRESREAVFGQVSADHRVGRVIEVDTPSVNPDDRDWLDRMFRGREDRATVDYVIVGA